MWKKKKQEERLRGNRYKKDKNKDKKGAPDVYMFGVSQKRENYQPVGFGRIP
jgi:hypothetical protein